MRLSLQAASTALAAALLCGSLYAQQKDTTAGEHLFAANCAACHGSDGKGGERAPNIAAQRNVIALSNNDLETIVTKGLSGAGMPPFSYLGLAKITQVVGYLRVLQGRTAGVKVTGDPAKGHDLFYGKAGCSACHMVHGEGGFIGSDLSSYGANQSPAAVRTAILEPDRILEPASRVAEVDLPNGQRLTGMLRQESNFALALQTPDGRYHLLSRDQVAKIHYTEHSSMPTNYGDTLSSKELDDLVSYLITTAPATKPASKNGSDESQ